METEGRRKEDQGTRKEKIKSRERIGYPGPQPQGSISELWRPCLARMVPTEA